MPRQPTGKPNGRPAKVAEAEEAIRLEDKSALLAEEAARKAKISARAVRGYKAKRRAAKRPTAARPATPHPPGPPAPSSAPAGNQGPALPQGGPVSGRPDLLELVRRILDARNGAARAELDEGLRVHAGGGEEALAPWLARPVEAVEVGVDELAALGRGLDLAVEVMQRAEPGGPALRALREVASLGKSVATVKARRPPVPTHDEVQEAIRAEMDGCVEGLLKSTREAAAKFARDREELGAWALGAFGAHGAAELGQRLDAMLGGPSS